MEKVYILKNVDNNKYWSGRYWDDYKYTTDIKDAKQYYNIDLLEEDLISLIENEGGSSYIEDVNMFEVITLYIKKEM
jgi:hypothetical protein